MGLIENAKRLKEVGEVYEETLNQLLNDLTQVISGGCSALEMEDSLFPVYAPSATKKGGILAFPFKCMGKRGYLIINEEGIFFEDLDGNVNKIRSLDEKA
ncbi:hypothetical protein [Sulfuracidifex metallicus]|uniref:hypothetical protein n=1 Tax=Sulfuracidifex metallicus TaxID=47303 RepID=UPI0022749D3F|nr:hypothetical protein [Sulfuracidifex metallicus]MCY0849420.1 hypothetical protein [Sulfuracidifex metallicus]